MTHTHTLGCVRCVMAPRRRYFRELRYATFDIRRQSINLDVNFCFLLLNGSRYGGAARQPMASPSPVAAGQSQRSRAQRARFSNVTARFRLRRHPPLPLPHHFRLVGYCLDYYCYCWRLWPIVECQMYSVHEQCMQIN